MARNGLHEDPARDRAERERRARLILARMVNEASALLVRLESDLGKLDVDGRDAAALGEYAAMFDDAIEGREPHDRRSRSRKVRKAFGFTVRR